MIQIFLHESCGFLYDAGGLANDLAVFCMIFVNFCVISLFDVDDSLYGFGGLLNEFGCFSCDFDCLL